MIHSLLLAPLVLNPGTSLVKCSEPVQKGLLAFVFLIVTLLACLLMLRLAYNYRN